jgi:hypothetical protein
MNVVLHNRGKFSPLESALCINDVILPHQKRLPQKGKLDVNPSTETNS